MTKKVAGVPIVVTVPQKTGFLVTEDFHYSNAGKVVEVTVDKTPIPLGRGQLVSLDVKRPFYGSLKGRIVLDAQRQYPTSVSSAVDDRTLGEILDALTGRQQNNVMPRKQRSHSQGTSRRRRHYLIVYDPETSGFSTMALPGCCRSGSP